VIRFNAQPVTLDAAPGGGEPPRTISGVALAWDETAVVSDGTAVRFERGAFDVNAKPAKLVENHNLEALIGVVSELADDPAGLLFVAKFAKTPAADAAIELVRATAYDAVSVGAQPVRFKYDDEGTMVVSEARLIELSLVPYGAFESARIDSLAAAKEIHAPAPADGHTHNQEPEGDNATMDQPAAAPIVEATIPTAPIPAAPRKYDMPRPGEYLAAFHVGGETWQRVNAAALEAAKVRQSAFEATIQAAAGDTTTTDTPLLSQRVLGPVFDDLNYIRPVVTAVGSRAMPDSGNSKTFVRPTWTTHTSVATQSSELDPVSQTTPVITANVITKSTAAGGFTMSVQDMDLTDPNAMDVVLRDLASQYLLKTDDLCADAIVAQGAASGVTWTFNATDPSDLIDSLYEVAESQLTTTGFLPDTLFVSPDVWRKLSRQLDAEKRPVFAYAGAAGLMGVNGLGTQDITSFTTLNPLGLNLVADRFFASGTMILARRVAIEHYEQVMGLRSVDLPLTLGRSFSYYGYTATFVADATMVSKITVA